MEDPNISPDSREWLAFKPMLEHRISIVQAKLESMSISEQETAHLRGEISAYRSIIRQVEQAPLPDKVQPLDYAFMETKQ